MKVLVTGGAGYIGSHATRQLLDEAHEVTVVDNLFRGHRAAVDDRATFFEVDLLDRTRLTEILKQRSIEAVMHFAALAYVGESVTDPLRYYENNTGGSLALFQAMQEAKVNRLVFSSTCATYGIPEEVPIVESTPQEPINPYGWSKLFVERMLIDLAAESNLGFIALRYFNVAGCSSSGEIGEDHHPETHLIPLAIQAALGRRDALKVFGTDYDTPDGTCIRDYVHVEDLCAAHILALDKIESGTSQFLNLGIGHGYSVREVIDSVGRVLEREVPAIDDDRRPGDPPKLIADGTLARQSLGWNPKFTDIDAVVRTTSQWFVEHPDGYGDT